MVMPLICHDNGLKHSEWEERDWAQEGRDTESKHGYEIETDRTSLGRPEPHNDPDWLLPWDTGPRGHGPLANNNSWLCNNNNNLRLNKVSYQSQTRVSATS